MENFEEKACLCALGKIFGFKPRIALALIEHLGSAREIFKISRNDLELLLGPHSQYTDIIRKSTVYEASKELEHYEKQCINYVGWTEEHYPPLLKECPDAPVGIYIRSRTPVPQLWTPEKSIAIVGTRDVSPYGKEWCSKAVLGLASSGTRPLIVSGLALGTDICAHKAAVEAGLPTVAVMATGPESVYPYRHREFADMMSQTPGCALITDYPPGTPPLAIHFLRRNRIIAGLSDATVLIESRLKGGGMMTARLAFSYSRDVYALPGRVDDIRSQGCNLLIKSKIAEPLTSIPDFLESMGLPQTKADTQVPDTRVLSNTYGSMFNEDKISQMASLVTTIRKERGITVEELADQTGLGYVRTAELTAILETDGFIKTDLLQRCYINISKK
ncbi:MAG: DNA-processing protein DprA [Bacteroidales bacterium]|nr:DNA-processing protein DprA [Bacteroidales bacterium]